MKKNILLIVSVIFVLTGCVKKEKQSFNKRDEMNLLMADEIVKCINKEDIDSLYALFSAKVKTQDLNLKEDIKKLYKYLNGQVVSCEKWAVGSTTEIENEINSTYYFSSFKIVINKIDYYLYYIYFPRNDFDSSREGIRSLKIVKVDEDDKYFCYWQSLKPGVFLPDEAK
ncbi:MAG: DUF5104 domain-containing protein [Treponema sp.]|uniref:DUF5104 domain-containing protein n=1 Tax=Treponema sp. TaxID=166 RepID=UPI00298DF2C4|nr:DUF5104 domain-containing protein [Treponema sp.]MCQ2599928.1 DUF5104 domain-containing protein [Treponema sp.]